MNENLINEINKRLNELEAQIAESEKIIKENEEKVMLPNGQNAQFTITDQIRNINECKDQIRTNKENLEVVEAVVLITKELPRIQKQIESIKKSIDSITSEIEEYADKEEEVQESLFKRRDNLKKVYRQLKNHEKVYLKYLEKGKAILPSLYEAYGIKEEDIEDNKAEEPKDKKALLEEELKKSAERMKEYKGFDEQYAAERANYNRITQELAELNKNDKEVIKAKLEKELKAISDRMKEYKDNGFYEQYAAERANYSRVVNEIAKLDGQKTYEDKRVELQEDLKKSAERMKEYKDNGFDEQYAAERANFSKTVAEIGLFGQATEEDVEEQSKYKMEENLGGIAKTQEDVKVEKSETKTEKTKKSKTNDTPVKEEVKEDAPIDDKTVHEIGENLTRFADQTAKDGNKSVPIVNSEEKALVSNVKNKITIASRVKKLLLKLAEPFKRVYRAVKNLLSKKKDANEAKKRAEDVLRKDREVIAESSKTDTFEDKFLASLRKEAEREDKEEKKTSKKKEDKEEVKGKDKKGKEETDIDL